MNRHITFSEGEYYHVYNRGVEKRQVFMDDPDHVRFQRMLFYANGDSPTVYKLLAGDVLDPKGRGNAQCAMGAYVLMPNHFHLLVRATNDTGITEFMRKLTTGYTMYFNKKYQRVGPLFQGTFKAEYVSRDEYLKYLFAYIHLNPVKLIDPTWRKEGIKDPAAAKKYLSAYVYSSMQDWQGRQRIESPILSVKDFPEYFEHAEQFDEYISDWLNFQGSTLE
ncbi:MAG: hypothetical protein A2845_06180 [Candidatus Lloydbacteria bacterium RIFCSPHIGHO2_01_FULL_49_22]|uniref:Transposase IS200-like domain-containing protein n=1 Tax=Candidatus Lloydbacteria bacterium RIFCSPHIGHO2_01_FULL_49_22 TaxID=1798658 RepID=A0A1G2CYX8_9BACT|nr:MAG: hypothetical protein A2845_06180 [Candidatus Lloydbacteria bacterium RIFCSPHIGHO2_01_FULL_49_22]OGZ08831.1 MAG: hypothetical protein A3C14_01190 [Candidatus Lloydbacteria bacterium RIFCSPHIGHO2_02_FULL_50_18]